VLLSEWGSSLAKALEVKPEDLANVPKEGSSGPPAIGRSRRTSGHGPCPTGEWVVAGRLRREAKAKHQAYVATARGNVKRAIMPLTADGGRPA